MQYITSNFQPVVTIPHDEVVKQLNNLQDYNFPIFQSNQFYNPNLLDNSLIKIFLGEVNKANQYITTTEFSEEDRIRKHAMLIHKVIHTDYSVSIALDIAKTMSDKIKEEQAVILAFLHDVGRFPELCQTGKHHAELSAEVVTMAYADNETLKQVIDKNFEISDLIEALREHSKAYYEGENIYAKFVRDIDKITIIGETIEQINRMHKVLNGMQSYVLSPNVRETYIENQIVFNEDRETKADALLTIIAFVSHLYFDESRSFVKERGLNNFLHQNFINLVLNIDNELKSILERELQIR